MAKEGRIVSQPESRSIALLFVDGTIFISAKKTADIRTIVFDTYDMTIGLDDIMPALSGRELSPKEMSYQALRRSLEGRKERDGRYHEMLREVTERFSIPFAVFLLVGCVWLLRRAAKERTINLLERFFPVQEA